MSESIAVAIISAIGVVFAAIAGNWLLTRHASIPAVDSDDEQTKKTLKRILKDKRARQRRLTTLKAKTKIYDHERLRRLLRSIGAHAVKDRDGEECWTLDPKR